MEKLEQAQELADWKLCNYAFQKRRAIEGILYRIKFDLRMLELETLDAREWELLTAIRTLTNWKG